MIDLIFYGIGLLIALSLTIAAIKRKNHFATILLIPYLVACSAGIFRNRDSLFSPDKETVALGEMRHLDNVSPSDAMMVIYKSHVVFGTSSCAGGIIREPEVDALLRTKLSSQNIPVNAGDSLIWLKDSKATKVILDHEVAFFLDQTEAKEGIWIVAVPEKSLARVKKMDANYISLEDKMRYPSSP